MANTSIWATSPLGIAIGYVVFGFFFFPSQVWCPLRFQNSPQTCRWEGFLMFGNLLLHDFLPGTDLRPELFCLLYFVLPPSEENGLPFWGPGILLQHSEVILWKLLSSQMIFWWICGGESGLLVLFLLHLRTAPSRYHFRLSHKGRLLKREGSESKCLRGHSSLRNSYCKSPVVKRTLALKGGRYGRSIGNKGRVLWNKAGETGLGKSASVRSLDFYFRWRRQP